MANLVHRSKLEAFFHRLLRPDMFIDYGPNGLQIEGTTDIERLAFAVSATRDSVKKTVQSQAQGLVVHHGLFWPKFHGAKTLTGAFAKRVFPLVRHEINLFAFHLPLDANLEVGNAKSLAGLLALENLAPFGDYQGCPTGVQGALPSPLSALSLKKALSQILGHSVIHSGPNENDQIQSIGIITGGANSDWPLAVTAGLDAYITGEISEHDWHEAQEAGIHMFAGGHHATEKWGVLALMKRVQKEWEGGLECLFIDSENPA